MRRTRLQTVETGGSYFAAPKRLEFISTGCRILNCVVGGGWVLGRITNIVGDKSTGKTLLAIEACANFARQYPKGKIYYRETEAAFDEAYAAALGMPVDRIDFGDKDESWETIEDIFEDLNAILDKEPNQPALYIIDSLDALSDRAEMLRDLDQGSFGTGKAKYMSQLFRRLVRKLERSKICVIIVSQIRDKIGVTFGEKKTRSGGHALDFYASQIVWLAHLKTLSKTVRGVKRPVGIRVLAKCKKNKVALPMRECEFEIQFGFGVDDLWASLEWLKEVKRLDAIDVRDNAMGKFMDQIEALPAAEYQQEMARVADAVEKVWYEIEESFLPKRRAKYGV